MVERALKEGMVSHPEDDPRQIKSLQEKLEEKVRMEHQLKETLVE